mgnify:FL=1
MSSNNVLAVYQELMNDLVSKPEEIATAMQYLVTYKQNLQDVTAAVEAMENDWVMAQGGMKAIGANEKEREIRLAMLRNSAEFRPAMDRLRRATVAVDDSKQLVARLERQYEAICHKARLTTAVFSYLGNLALPIGNAIIQAAGRELFDLPNDASPAVNSATNGAVSILDAEAIGL